MTSPSITRRRFLTTASIGAAACASGLSCTAERPSTGRPNVLILFTDDQRFDTLRALGNTDIRTPAMDSLVRGGVTFANAYIMGGMSAAVCQPSRAMLITGRHLLHIDGNGAEIDPATPTMPEVFRAAGYRTHHIGKWHNGKKTFARGFDGSGSILFGGMSSHYDMPHHDFDPTGKYPKEAMHHTQGIHSSELYADEAVRFIESGDGDEPFFLYVAFQAPHDPREMPREYLDMYDPTSLPLPPSFLPRHPFDNGELDVRDETLAPWPRTPDVVRGHIAAYYAMITHLDVQIGRILDALSATGRVDDTIIVFAGDNGLAVGRHGLMGKQNLYEHSVHVPLVISGPGIGADVRRDDLCYLHDIFPTLCDLAGIGTPPTVDGMSLAPALDDSPREHRESLMFAYKNFQRAVLGGRWKLILYNVHGEHHTQLFDLSADPWETNDLSASPEHADRVARMTALLDDWLTRTGDPVDLDAPDWGVPEIPSWTSRYGKPKTN